MAADVFANDLWLAAKIENAGGVNTAGARKLALEFSQKRRQRKQGFDVDPDTFRRSNRRKILSNRGNAFLAANAATARNCSESLGGAEFHFHTIGQMHRDDVFAITGFGWTRELGDLVASDHDSFGKEETGGELFIVTGRAHGDGKSLRPNANLERLFDGKIVPLIFERAVILSPNDLPRADAVFFHGSDGDGIMMPVEICHVYISSGHNFVGHHGREPDDFPMIEVRSIECMAGRGIRGDRYLDFKDDYKGQVTFFSLEVFDELCRALELHDCSPALARRNVITRQVDLKELIDQDFEVQGVRFHGTQECRPCYWMDRAIGVGAEKFLQGRGGLRARVLTDGTLRSTTRVAELVG